MVLQPFCERFVVREMEFDASHYATWPFLKIDGGHGNILATKTITVLWPFLEINKGYRNSVATMTCNMVIFKIGRGHGHIFVTKTGDMAIS